MNPEWRRRRGADERSPAATADDSFVTAVLLLVVGALLTVTTGLWVMLQLERFGPTVGNVIVFKPTAAATDRWSVAARVAEAGRPGIAEDSSNRRCILAPNVMAQRGGSLVVEARRLSRPPLYRVHWAGGPTDTGGQDCGSSADRGAAQNEILCFLLDGTERELVVAPVMTDLDASGGGSEYYKLPKGNLDITGQYFIWTTNTGGNRIDAFLVKVPAQLLLS